MLVLSAAAIAAASDWDGYADTGWRYRDKRSCCEDAIVAAQEDSIANCEHSGGVPAVSRSGSARGNCDWDSKGGTYRCTATASVRCR